MMLMPKDCASDLIVMVEPGAILPEIKACLSSSYTSSFSVERASFGTSKPESAGGGLGMRFEGLRALSGDFGTATGFQNRENIA